MTSPCAHRAWAVADPGGLPGVPSGNVPGRLFTGWLPFGWFAPIERHLAATRAADRRDDRMLPRLPWLGVARAGSVAGNAAWR